MVEFPQLYYAPWNQEEDSLYDIDWNVLLKETEDYVKNVIFGGRLAEYKYYDMAPIVEKVLGMDII